MIGYRISWNFNGGGHSGYDTNDDSSRPGGGGSATDLRLYYNNFMSRVMVAGGGSGGFWNCNGAYGGDDKMICPVENNKYQKENGWSLDGHGGNGNNAKVGPGSGGGGGYMGGRGGNYCNIADSSYIATRCGGSSYISSDESPFGPHELLKFESPEIWTDNNTGDGKVEIIPEYQCSTNCAACTSSMVCTECFEGFLYNGECKDSCNEGYAEVDHECKQCNDECSSCKGSPSYCTSCKEGFHLYNNQCTQSTPNGTTLVGDKYKKCKKPCKECSSSVDQCTSCIDNFYLHGTQCVSKCPDGTVKVNFKCEPCQQESHCKTCCSSPDKCSSCIENYSLYENKCVPSSECLGNMFSLNNVCVGCKSPCKNCSSENNCLSCIDNFYLHEDKCLPVCPDGTIPSDGNCIQG